MKMKAWYFLCILFFFYSINTLIDESYDVVYRFENKTEEYKYLACLDLKKLLITNKKLKEIDLNQLNQNVFNYLDKLEDGIKTMYLQEFNESILFPIKQRECLVFRGMFCFRAENKTKLIRIDKFSHLFKNIFAYKNNTFDLIKMKTENDDSKLDKFDQQVVLHRAYPYSNCTEDYSRFHCLNKCFKVKNSLSKYMYRTNEKDVIIQLNYNSHNKTLKDNEDECLKKCKNNECKFTYFTKKKYQWEESKINYFKAHPTMSSYDYWIQLAGLVFFFISLSSYQILSKFIKILNSSVFFNRILFKFIKLIRSKIRKDKLKPRLLNSTKVIIMVIMISFLIYSYFDLITAYNCDLNKPIKKEISLTLLEPEPISFVICVDLGNIFMRDYSEDFNFENEIYQNKSLLELEKETEIGFNDTFDGIYMIFENEKIEVKWTLKPKVLFYKYCRCFFVDVFPSEPKYQSALLITKLIIKFQHNFYYFFLLPYGQSFHSNSHSFETNFDFIKKIRKSTKECKNYNRLNSKSHCFSQGECIDRCYNQEFIKNYGNISGYSVIDKDHFTKEQWKKLFAVYEFDENISRKCEKEIFKKDCNEVKFEKNILGSFIYDYKVLKFDLYYSILKKVEIEPTVYDLLVSMMNIQSYFFGLNIFKLLFMIYLLIKSKLKPHIILITIYIICMLGSTYQTYYILNKIINEELDQSQHYKLLETLKMPEIIFCFSFNESLIDMNHKLTESYLDEITKEVRIETVFDRIRYHDNKTNKWIILKSNFTDDKFRIEEFFFLNQKCFKIMLGVEYHRDQFHFSLDSNFGSNVLEIFFKLKFTNRMFYFMTKPKDQIQFSKLLKLSFIDLYMFRKTVLISQELFELTYYDKFNFIKNPISVFYGENELNDAAQYLSNLLNNFKKSFNHLRTLKLPMKESHFNDEIDDDLFEQYYLQIQNVTDNYLTTDSNYQRLLATNYYEIINRQKSDFIFNLIFYKKVITTTNRDNHTRLIINLLNVLSIWFDLGVLDLHAYAYKIKFIFTFIFKLLLEIERLIKKVLVMTHCS